MRKLLKLSMICLAAFLLLLSVLTIGKNSRVHGGNAMDYFNLGMETSLANKKIAYFTKALELNPSLAPAYEKRGISYYFQRKYDKVIEDFSKYIDLVPDKSDARRMLGMAYLKTGNYNKSVFNFDAAINMEPGMVAAYAYRAEAHRLNGNLQHAVADATSAIKLNRDLGIISDAYKTRSMAYRELGREDRADEDYNRYFEMNPRFVFYKDFARYASLKAMRTAGFFGLIGIAFIVIFGFRMKPPEKDE